MKTKLTAMLASLLALPAAVPAQAQLDPGQREFFGIYKELIETDTTLSQGSCTEAAAKMAARLKTAGLKDDQLFPFSVPDHPKDGGLVAVYPGTTNDKAVLLLAHIDVVEAKREDWERDPFKLVEENGYYYARGAVDDKAMAAIWVDTLGRFAKAGHKPRRTIKLALTCGEETSGAFNGAQWLTQNKRDLIDAAFALNEGGGGRTDGKPVAQGGKVLVQTLQVGEKAYQDFTLTATNPGGHSSQPMRHNAIYDVSGALLRIADHAFPIEFNDVTRAYFSKAGQMRGGEVGRAMQALGADPGDKAALAVVERDKMLNALLRTTCVATLVEGGHAQNALPQRASANVNCRMFPGRTADETQAELTRVVNDPRIAIVQKVRGKPIAKSPPLDPAVVQPIEQLAARHFPGVPVIPAMSTGATDGVYLSAVGIPTYGVPSVWTEPDGNGTHGLNERVEVEALYTARAYLYDLVKAFGG